MSQRMLRSDANAPAQLWAYAHQCTWQAHGNHWGVHNEWLWRPGQQFWMPAIVSGMSYYIATLTPRCDKFSCSNAQEHLYGCTRIDPTSVRPVQRSIYGEEQLAGNVYGLMISCVSTGVLHLPDPQTDLHVYCRQRMLFWQLVP